MAPNILYHVASIAISPEESSRGDSMSQASLRSAAGFTEIYEILYEAYGRQKWWPVTPPGGEIPAYTGGPRNELQRFEVAAGAVLTQNTAWRNAARAIENLNRAGALNPERLSTMDARKLAALIRPAGYYNQKAKRLRQLAHFFQSGEKVTRESLLALNGVGPETADSILLYACGRLKFIIDAYTRRIFSRLGLLDKNATYDAAQAVFQENIPRKTLIYKEFHALIVEHAKRHCRTKPVCEGCALLSRCTEGNLYKKKNCR
jgi:endonuclease-3 related protein